MEVCIVKGLFAIVLIDLCFKEVYSRTLKLYSLGEQQADLQYNDNKISLDNIFEYELTTSIYQRKEKKKRKLKHKKFNWPAISVEEQFKYPKGIGKRREKVLREFEKADPTVDSNESKKRKPVDITVHIKMNDR